jgi:hypothetical protein
VRRLGNGRRSGSGGHAPLPSSGVSKRGTRELRRSQNCEARVDARLWRIHSLLN